MRILHRHILGQVTLSVAMSVGLFMFVMIAGSMKEVLFPLANGLLGWSEFFHVLALNAPSVLPYSLPMGVLAGVLIVLGRMSSQNEILAMKAAGISLWRITAPIFLIAGIASVLSAAINLEQAPRAADTVKTILYNSFYAAPARLINPGEFRHFKNHIIYAKERDGNLLKNVWIWETNTEGLSTRIIHARTAHVSYDPATELFKLAANDVSMEELDRSKPEDFGDTIRFHGASHLPVQISVNALFENLERNRKLRHHTLGDLLKLRHTGWQMSEADRRDPQKVFANRILVQLQIQNHLASALSIISMTMLAIPLGIKTGRSETLVNVALALALALTFYMLNVAVSWIKNPALRPDILIWLPNFLFQAIGGMLLWRASRR
ncbi:MAG: LptF/LptG family permease [Puniceicoccales bacterium]|jgi:lipopolysaccharide export system permease protein|nr:LptF/LptG family permease [Puniceicoccales bacterium]